MFLFLHSVLGDAGGYKYWDIGRGIYHNDKKTFLVWVNEEDHLRLISMQKGGDLGEVYRRLVKVRTKLYNTGKKQCDVINNHITLERSSVM